MNERSENPFLSPNEPGADLTKPIKPKRIGRSQIMVGIATLIIGILSPFPIIDSIVGGFGGTYVGFRFINGSAKHVLFGMLGAATIFTLSYVVGYLAYGSLFPFDSFANLLMFGFYLVFSIPGSLAALLLSMLIYGRSNL